MKVRLTKAVGLILIFFVVFGCKKKGEDRAYYPPVDEYINITLPSNNTLAVPGGWTYVNGGLKGIIVYRRSNDDFVAYDRNCTYNEANSCGTATVKSDNVTIECSCDGSEYNIFDGSVNNGPASLPLRAYNTSFNSGNNTLRIYN